MNKSKADAEIQKGPSGKTIVGIGSVVLIVGAIFADKLQDILDKTDAQQQAGPEQETLPKNIQEILIDVVKMYDEISGHFDRKDIHYLEFLNLCTEYKMQAALYKTSPKVQNYPIVIRHIDVLIEYINKKEAIINQVLDAPPKERRKPIDLI